MSEDVASFAQVVLDTTDARRLAEFYRQLLGYDYRPGDEPSPAGGDDPRGRDWLVLLAPGGESCGFTPTRQGIRSASSSPRTESSGQHDGFGATSDAFPVTLPCWPPPPAALVP